MKPPVDYSLGADSAALRAEHREFCSGLASAAAIEFFYYLETSEAENYFIIRVESTAAVFVPAIREFAERRNFTILNAEQSRPILKRIDLNTFV